MGQGRSDNDICTRIARGSGENLSYWGSRFAKRGRRADIHRTKSEPSRYHCPTMAIFVDRRDSTGLSNPVVAILPGSPAGIKCTFVHLFTGVGDMPKQKTHKGMKRRFKITASGKAKHRSAFRGHLLSGKSSKRKRSLRNGGVSEGKDAKNIIEALRPSL